MPKVTVSIEFASEAEAAAYLGGSKGSTGGASSSSSKPAADKPKAPKYNKEQMTDAMNKLKALSDAETCRSLITEVVGAQTKMADVKEEYFDAIVEKANAASAKIEKDKADEM